MNKLLQLYRANKSLWNLGFAFIICSLIHNNPWLLDFLPEDAKKSVQTLVYLVINNGVLALSFLVKQFNTSGSGTLAEPFKKPDGDGGTKIVP